MSFPPSGILRTYNGFSPVGLICLTDRVSRPAIANVRLRFPVKPGFFKVLFQLQFWRCYTDSFFNRLGLFILQRRLFSLFFSSSTLQNMIHFTYFNWSFLKLNKNVRKCHKNIPICNGLVLTLHVNWENSRYFATPHWFSREMTSERRAQIFHSDDA